MSTEGNHKPIDRVDPPQHAPACQVLKILEAAKVEDRSVNRLLKIQEAAQLELRDLEADFQFRLQESIQQTEAKLKQRFAKEQEQKMRQIAEEVRKATTRELLARFEVDFQKLSGEFEERRKNAIAATENAAQLRLKEVLGEAERAKEDVKRQFESAAGQWEMERQQLCQEITKLGEARTANLAAQGKELAELEMKLSEVSHEKARLQEEFRVAESHWNTERNSLKSEMEQSREESLSRFETDMEQLKADFEDRRLKDIAASEAAAEFFFAEKFDAAKQEFERREQEIQATANQRFQEKSGEFDAERKEFHQRIATLEEEITRSKKMLQQVIRTPLSRELEAKLEDVTREKTRLEEEVREANARRNAEGQGLETTQAARNDTRDFSDAVKAEIARIESRELEICQTIQDPSMDLGTQIRLDRERSELEAYLKGLRYSIGEIMFDNQT